MKSILHLIPFILLLILQAPTTQAQEIEEEDWNYDENSWKGPSEWGNLRPDWAICNKGKMQSPVDLTDVTVELLSGSEQVYKQYQPASTALLNKGHDIELQWRGDAGSIEISGIQYQLRQVHWHVPSEHTVNGKRYNLERHAVHINADTNETAVISVLYKIGKKDPLLSQLSTNLMDMVETSVNETYPGVIDPNDITYHDQSFYRYMGSLTTPPCTEGVLWTIQRKIRTVSREQVNLLLDAVHGNNNARPLQAINGRGIYLYVPYAGTDWSVIFSPTNIDWSIIFNPLQYLQRKLFYRSA